MRMVPRALACAFLVVSCGGDELLLPAEGEPSTIAIVSGDAQTGPIGGQLAEPLVVRVTDTRGRPVTGIDVAFAPDAGAVQSETANTDADGLAATHWTLGMQTGPQQLNVSVPSASPPLSVRFNATASAGAARGLIIVSGNGQSAPAGSQLPLPLVVRLLDASGNPISGGEVSWVVGQGGGNVDPATSSTGGDGTSSAAWTLGPALGTNTLTAIVTGVGRVEFSAIGTAGPPVRLLLNGGNNQSAAPGSALGTPLSVKAVDAGGNGVAGVAVSWAVTAGGGSLSTPTTLTRADGTAEVTWTLGPAEGTQTARATAAGLQGSPVTFTATATPAAPPPPPPPPTPDPARSSLTADPTSFEAGSGSSSITVTVRDAQGTPISNVPVQINVSGSGNTVTQPGSTNASGVATGSFTSTEAGTKTVSASAGGVAIQQTATVTVTAAPPPPPPPPPPTPDPSRSTLSADPTSFQAGSGSSTITVTVRDAQGNPMPGVPVQISVSGSGNTVTQPGSTDASGVATGSFTSTEAGTKTVTASAGGVTLQQTATVTVTEPPPPPPPAPDAGRSSLSAEPTSFEAGSGSSTVVVTVREAQGNPLAGVPVELTVSGTGNTVTQPGPTNSSGVATGSFTSTVAETKTISATAGEVTLQQTATVTVTAPPPPPPTSDPSQTTAQVPNGVAGSPTAIAIQVRDATGTPITTGGEDVAVSVSGANTVPDVPVTDNGDGSYQASYTPQTTGIDQVAIALSGEPIGGSPYTSTVAAGAASQVGFLIQPRNEGVGQVFRPPIDVAVQDRFANVVTGSSALITLAVAADQNNPGALTGTLTHASVAGVATFDDLVITQAGEYTLLATSPGLDPAQSSAFQVSDEPLPEGVPSP
jgi:adhesin/invasin